MPDATTPLPLTRSRAEQIFPILTPAQIGRIAAIGRRRAIRSGEVLVEQGDGAMPFFVVVSGELEAVRPTVTTETLITVFRAGQFTGEVNTLSGRPALARIRARQPGEVIELSRENVLALVQIDEELSEILMRAFILRRVELLTQGIGDVTLVGSNHSADTLRIKEFLTRSGHPYTYIDLDRDADVQALLDRFQISTTDTPVVICRGETILRNPKESANRRLPELQSGHGGNAGARLDSYRCRSLRPGIGGLWRLRRSRGLVSGDAFTRRSGRFQFEN